MLKKKGILQVSTVKSLFRFKKQNCLSADRNMYFYMQFYILYLHGTIAKEYYNSNFTVHFYSAFYHRECSFHFINEMEAFVQLSKASRQQSRKSCKQNSGFQSFCCSFERERERKILQKQAIQGYLNPRRGFFWFFFFLEQLSSEGELTYLLPLLVCGESACSETLWRITWKKLKPKQSTSPQYLYQQSSAQQ